MRKMFNSILGLSLLGFTACSTTVSTSENSGLRAGGGAAVYEFESGPGGFNTKTIFVDSGREVFAFDAQFRPDDAKKAIEFLRTKTKNPLTHLIVTHPNPDKFNGAAVFRDNGAKIVMSADTARAVDEVHAYKKAFFVEIAKMFKAEEYPNPVKADVVFADRLVLKGASHLTIELRELHKPGVSVNQTIARVPALNALIVGDLVHHKSHAWLEGGIKSGKAVPTLSSWRAILGDLMSQSGESNPIVYGGRGVSVKASKAFPEQIKYLQDAEAITSQFVTEQRTLLISEPQKAYQKLTEKFEENFPSYGLSYMVQYGVCGLTNQLLGK